MTSLVPWQLSSWDDCNIRHSVRLVFAKILFFKATSLFGRSYLAMGLFPWKAERECQALVKFGNFLCSEQICGDCFQLTAKACRKNVIGQNLCWEYRAVDEVHFRRLRQVDQKLIGTRKDDASLTRTHFPETKSEWTERIATSWTIRCTTI